MDNKRLIPMKVIMNGMCMQGFLSAFLSLMCISVLSTVLCHIFKVTQSTNAHGRQIYLEALLCQTYPPVFPLCIVHIFSKLSGISFNGMLILLYKGNIGRYTLKPFDKYTFCLKISFGYVGKKSFFLSYRSKSPFLQPFLRKVAASVSGKLQQQKTDAARFSHLGV